MDVRPTNTAIQQSAMMAQADGMLTQANKTFFNNNINKYNN